MSKGLEAFNFIFDDLRQFEEYFLDGLTEEDKERYEIVLKELKALEIIKKKEVNVNTLINSIIGAIEPLEFYNEKVSTNLKLTQQECELLKEVLEEVLKDEN